MSVASFASAFMSTSASVSVSVSVSASMSVGQAIKKADENPHKVEIFDDDNDIDDSAELAPPSEVHCVCMCIYINEYMHI